MADDTLSIQQVFDDSFSGRSPSAKPSQRFTDWQDKRTPSNMRLVVDDLDPVISKAIQTYSRGYDSPVVRQRARILAAKAVQSWDPERGANLQTHVSRSLQALQQMAPRISDPVPLPERFRRQQGELIQATTDLEHQLGREPSDEELADVTGLPLKRVIRVRSRMRARLPMSTYETDDEDDTSHPDAVGSTRTDLDDWVDTVYSDLGELDKTVMMHRMGYRGAPQLSNQQIAEKLGVSPALISQRAKRIQQKMDDFYG